MMNKYRTLILGAMLGFGTLAFSGAGASAAAMLPLASGASGQANVADDGIAQVDYKKKLKNNNYNNWCKYNKCYRKKHRHNDFDRSYLFLPLVIGGFGAYNYYDDDYGYDGAGSAHVEWCLNRYRSYNPRTNLWVSYSGKKHQCISPYY